MLREFSAERRVLTRGMCSQTEKIGGILPMADFYLAGDRSIG